MPTSPATDAADGADALARSAPRVQASTRAALLAAALGGASAALSGLTVGGPAAWGTLALTVATAAAGSAAVARWWVQRHVEAPLARVAAALGAAAADGDPEALAARADELTERLRAGEMQRARAEKLATVGRMAAGIAHEVGNPLAAINGYTHVLRGRAAGVRDVTPVLDALERESGRIERIVRGLLDFARPRRVTPAGIGVNTALEGAVALLRDQGVLRRVQVDATLARPEPVVFAEAHELQQVLVNLLLNAADALESGPGTIALITREVDVAQLGQGDARRAGDAPEGFVPPRRNRRVTEWLTGTVQAPRTVVQIVVADSGPGVPEHEWERVFDPFYTTKEAGRGTGLGLAIVARTVDQLGGAVWVQRAREGGAAFVILLPRVESSGAALAAVAPPTGEQLDLPLRR
jgi:signal transduction histidine kinase